VNRRNMLKVAAGSAAAIATGWVTPAGANAVDCQAPDALPDSGTWPDVFADVELDVVPRGHPEACYTVEDRDRKLLLATEPLRLVRRLDITTPPRTFIFQRPLAASKARLNYRFKRAAAQGGYAIHCMIIDSMKMFYAAHGREPTTLYVTSDMEDKLTAFYELTAGTLFTREAYTLGFSKVFWGASDFQLE